MIAPKIFASGTIAPIGTIEGLSRAFKDLMTVFAPVLALALLTGLAGSACAQTITPPPGARPTDPTPMIANKVNNPPGQPVETIVPFGTIIQLGTDTSTGTTAVVENSEPASSISIMADSLETQSTREATVSAMTRVIAQIVKQHGPGSTQRLRSGKAIDLTTMIDTGMSVAEWHSVNLKANYDARPIGGILSIRVGLAPVFGGIGSAVRSVVYREFDEAVDTFDDDFIASTISRLTKELAEEYTAK